MAQEYIEIGTALGYSLLGVAIVFTVLVVLIGLIKLIQKLGGSKEAPAAAPAPAPAPAAAAAPAVPAGKVPAKGSLGDVQLHTVDDRTAAMLMAVVADKLDAPLNQLRFISIKEIKE